MLRNSLRKEELLATIRHGDTGETQRSHLSLLVLIAYAVEEAEDMGLRNTARRLLDSMAALRREQAGLDPDRPTACAVGDGDDVASSDGRVVRLR